MLIALAYSSWSSFRSVSKSILAKPMTAFIGVRISWLMLARNADLRRDAPSASSQAVSNSSFVLKSLSDISLKATASPPNSSLDSRSIFVSKLPPAILSAPSFNKNTFFLISFEIESDINTPAAIERRVIITIKRTKKLFAIRVASPQVAENSSKIDIADLFTIFISLTIDCTFSPLT